MKLQLNLLFILSETLQHYCCFKSCFLFFYHHNEILASDSFSLVHMTTDNFISSHIFIYRWEKSYQHGYTTYFSATFAIAKYLLDFLVLLVSAAKYLQQAIPETRIIRTSIITDNKYTPTKSGHQKVSLFQADITKGRNKGQGYDKRKEKLSQKAYATCCTSMMNGDNIYLNQENHAQHPT